MVAEHPRYLRDIYIATPELPKTLNAPTPLESRSAALAVHSQMSSGLVELLGSPLRIAEIGP